MAPKSDRPAFSARLAALACALGMSLGAAGAAAQQAAQPPVKIGYIRSAVPPRVPISLIERPAPDDGIAGAQLAIEDNNTTGRFMKQEFELVDAAVSDQQQAADALGGFAAGGIRFLVADLPAELLVPVADAAGGKRHAGLQCERHGRQPARRSSAAPTSSTSRRAGRCSPMRSPSTWPGRNGRAGSSIVGSHPADEAYAAAIRRAAKRFGAEIVEERVFKDTGGARTTDTGTVQVQRQIPVFMQGAPDHHVVVVADESEVFGAYMPFRTWTPAPGRRHRRAEAGKLVAGARPMGGHPDAEPLPGRLPPADDGEGHRRLDGGPHYRRGGDAHQQHRSRQDGRVHQRPDLRGRRLQGPEAHFARLGPAAAPADPARRTARPWCRSLRRRASCTRHRSSTRSATTGRRRNAASDAACRRRGGVAATPEAGQKPARAAMRPHNEGADDNDEAVRPGTSCRNNSVRRASGSRLQDLRLQRGRQHHVGRRFGDAGSDRDGAGRPAPARHHHDEGWQIRAALRLRRQHGADHRRGDLPDRRHAAIGARSGALRAASLGRSPLHRQRERQSRHGRGRGEAHARHRDPGRRGAGRDGHLAGRQGHGEHVGDDEHGPFHRHGDQPDHP